MSEKVILLCLDEVFMSAVVQRALYSRRMHKKERLEDFQTSSLLVVPFQPLCPSRIQQVFCPVNDKRSCRNCLSSCKKASSWTISLLMNTVSTNKELLLLLNVINSHGIAIWSQSVVVPHHVDSLHEGQWQGQGRAWCRSQAMRVAGKGVCVNAAC